MTETKVKIPKQAKNLASGQRAYEIPFAEDDVHGNEILAHYLELAGHKPVPFRDGQHLLNYLRQPGNLSRAGMIFLDYQMPRMDGQAALNKIRELDKGVPIYFISGESSHEEVAKFIQRGANGFIEKPVDVDDLIRLINGKVLLQRFDFGGKMPILLRPGGSADDVDKETQSYALGHLARIAEYLQNTGMYQVFASVGAGKMGNIAKAELRKWGDPRSPEFRPLVQKKYAAKYAKCLDLNAENFYNLSSSRQSPQGTFELLSPEHFANQNRDEDGKDLETILNSGKVIVVGRPPRHLGIQLAEALNGMGCGEIVYSGAKEFPNVPLDAPDSNTALWALPLNPGKIIYVKRTDAIYNKDPYLLYERRDKIWKANLEGRERIEPLSFVPFEDIFSERIQFIGADDGQLEHLMGRATAGIHHLFRHKGVYICHIYPSEMYRDGKHVITGDKIPLGDDMMPLTDMQMLTARIINILEDKAQPQIRLAA